MARKTIHLVFLLVLSLCLTQLFTSIQARPINVPNHHRRHEKTNSPPCPEGNGRHYAEILSLRGIKDSGPSPGEGHSVTNGLHN
ncbi:hypothetical protein RHMOL_Rhmol08G0067900 [Rhododendron molle]|uniref:Uncharacterized protein n=1 Tax=Rhododendron molle TaxID=49168 RepID=A0ACC0MMG4_RHOML|nr:hypothetical protein RHMOL_Rhmol08G0067900 [Rhododendron molle]